ncbi:hypothetical protein AUEXF2481DRAFT_37615 [Aureobasidium subglaciale EXF-2481]|uniref:Uncharacterized protein n=1 Tax=Aureobasidium subglaciale (strain EXF-2481) TaxID=1043005 RepID=A0A074YK20_AURSE|nr:uncharacterized protein AUEXF2481DRAFT_37615 [Aureobasidium subglaciale EXF-2481]KEQ98045.1 hypothetical protein AUEXF2481DRAFT_37615 [Aureobasidium subglaciale EXF-2481]
MEIDEEGGTFVFGPLTCPSCWYVLILECLYLTSGRVNLLFYSPLRLALAVTPY